MYRLGVGIFLLNKENKVWIGKRLDNQEAWQMPQGGVDKNENPDDAVLRELMEETGIDGKYVEIISKSHLLKYDIPDSLLKTISWGNVYKGQEQYWYAMRFLGNDSNINLNTHHEVEFSEWKWVEPKEILDYSVSFKKDMYLEILKHFSKILG